jgi:hypothetical protein
MTMKLFGKKPKPQKIELDNGLVIAQAEYLKSNLYVANIGTTSVIFLLAYLFWRPDLAKGIAPWVCFSLSSTIFRSILMFVYRKTDCFADKPRVAKNICTYIRQPRSYRG